jgi:hypothetical protein
MDWAAHLFVDSRSGGTWLISVPPTGDEKANIILALWAAAMYLFHSVTSCKKLLV